MFWYFAATDPVDAQGARPLFVRFLKDAEVPDPVIFDAQLVFGELLANVIRHAPGPVEVRFHWPRNGPAELQVHDEGPGFDVTPQHAAPFKECGRGLNIVHQLASSVTLHKVPHDGMCVRAELNLA